MVYTTFQTKIISRLQSQLGSHYRITLQKIPKNNGTILDGLCITCKGHRASPAIYLNSYYERYLQGDSINSIIREILQIYRDHSSVLKFDFSIFEDFSRLKDKVAYKLIHTDSNRELLSSLPSVPYLDLSIIFYIYLKRPESDQMTVLIRNDLMNLWNTSVEELHQLASVNTPRLLPARLHTMTEILQWIASDQSDTDYAEALLRDLAIPAAASPLFVQTNSTGHCGACTILYPNQLKNFAEQAGTDLIILPSSIHEVMLIPNDNTFSFQELSEMVSHINQTEVSEEDRLSDQIYVYSRSLDRVIPVL